MSFNPLKEKGTPLEKQFRSWSDINVETYDKNEVHPYTRTRVILMNGIEVEGVIFKHQFARHTDDMELRRKLAATRRAEQQQQKMVNWFTPADESVLEVTIGYEQVAVDLTAELARTEPDKHVKAALEYALIEDFDHLYRYADLMQMTEGKKAEKLVGEYTEIMPGRPTELEHQHPFDTVRKPVNSKKADLLTNLHILTIIAAEQQTMNFYMNVGNRAETKLGRGLYQEIGMIEEQHVTHYESLADPTASWFEMALMHEYNEAYMYYSCMESEVDPKMKKFWEQCLSDEIEHIKMAADMLKQHQGIEAEELLHGGEFPELTMFRSNKDYVRQVIASQLDLTGNGPDYISKNELGDDSNFWQFQKKINSGQVPSHEVINQCIDSEGKDYRFETEGPHPVERFQARETVEV